jgi:hypothetical protein
MQVVNFQNPVTDDYNPMPGDVVYYETSRGTCGGAYLVNLADERSGKIQITPLKSKGRKECELRELQSLCKPAQPRFSVPDDLFFWLLSIESKSLSMTLIPSAIDDHETIDGIESFSVGGLLLDSSGIAVIVDLNISRNPDGSFGATFLTGLSEFNTAVLDKKGRPLDDYELTEKAQSQGLERLLNHEAYQSALHSFIAKQG